VFRASFEFLSDPSRFAPLGELGYHDFEVQKGRYMMMGDNSPRSYDSRAWTRKDAHGYFDAKRRMRVEPWAEHADRATWEVPESLIIGKAFFIYWPHGVPFWPSIPLLGRDFRVPFRPYLERMKWIR
jgi:signal peptidase I